MSSSGKISTLSIGLIVIAIIAGGAATYMFVSPPSGPVQTVTLTKTSVGTVTQTAEKTVEQTVTTKQTVTTQTTVTPPKESLVDLAKKEGKVVLVYVSGSWFASGITKTFTAKYGIPVEGIKFQSADIFARVTGEYEAKQYNFDVIVAPVARVVLPLANAGVIKPYVSPNIDAFPPGVAPKLGTYLANDGGTYGIVYNKDKVTPEQAGKLTLESLATDTSLRGRIGIHNFDKDQSWSVLAGRYEEWGKDKLYQWLTSLVKNQKAFVHPDDGFLQQMLTKGEVDILYPFAIETAEIERAKGAAFGWVKDPKTVTAFVMGAALFRNSPHPNAAQLLHDFLTSKEGQEITGKTRFAARSDIDRTVGAWAGITAAQINSMYWIDEAKWDLIALPARDLWGRVKNEQGL